VARAIWTGALAFGLVNVPVGLYSATEDKTIGFRQFQRGTSSRIRYRRVNEDTGEEVAYGDIVKGYDLGDGQYVILEPEELEAVEPGRTRTIDISDFVDVAEIDPIYFQKTYYLAPQEESAERAYTLLARAMDKAGRIGIATFVMRSKQYLAAVRPQGDVLTLETMFFADEVRDPAEEIDRLPTDAAPTGKDLDMAVSLIDSMTTTWDPTAYRDTYREKVLDLIEAKRSGQEVVTPEEPAEDSTVVDLLDALQRSVAAARGRRGEPSGGGEDLSALSKQELYERAKAADLPGRSGMSKEELVEALAAVRGEQAKAS
jgi:DNA end-binding protein Ku